MSPLVVLAILLSLLSHGRASDLTPTSPVCLSHTGLDSTDVQCHVDLRHILVAPQQHENSRLIVPGTPLLWASASFPSACAVDPLCSTAGTTAFSSSYTPDAAPVMAMVTGFPSLSVVGATGVTVISGACLGLCTPGSVLAQR